MAVNDKLFLADKRTLDLAKNKVDNIYAIVPTTPIVPSPSPLDKNYVADKSTLDSMKNRLDTLPVFTPDGTAVHSDVLAGKTFLSNGIEKRNGTMPNRGTITTSLTTQNGQYVIPSGYHDGFGKVTATFPNLTSSNIKKGVNIGGVVGTATTVQSKLVTLNMVTTESNSYTWFKLLKSDVTSIGLSQLRSNNFCFVVVSGKTYQSKEYVPSSSIDVTEVRYDFNYGYRDFKIKTSSTGLLDTLTIKVFAP